MVLPILLLLAAAAQAATTTSISSTSSLATTTTSSTSSISSATSTRATSTCKPTTITKGTNFYLYQYSFQLCVDTTSGHGGPCNPIDYYLENQDTVRKSRFDCSSIEETRDGGRTLEAPYTPGIDHFKLDDAGDTQQHPVDLNFTQQCDGSYYVVPLNETTSTPTKGHAVCVPPTEPIQIDCPFNENHSNTTLSVVLTCIGSIPFI